MGKCSNGRKQMQLVSILTSVMVPVIAAFAIMELYHLLGVAIAMELLSQASKTILRLDSETN